jgi:hypothetical protein
MEELVDAFLYLGPQDLRLREQLPADIALDEDYLKELNRRMVLVGFPKTEWSSAEFRQQIVNGAEDQLHRWPKLGPPDQDPIMKNAMKNCLERRSHDPRPRRRRPMAGRQSCSQGRPRRSHPEWLHAQGPGAGRA